LLKLHEVHIYFTWNIWGEENKLGDYIQVGFKWIIFIGVDKIKVAVDMIQLRVLVRI